VDNTQLSIIRLLSTILGWTRSLRLRLCRWFKANETKHLSQSHLHGPEKLTRQIVLLPTQYCCHWVNTGYLIGETLALPKASITAFHIKHA